MGTQGTGRRRSTKKERTSAEEEALNLVACEAEARLAAKRASRAEAREIRMKELERQQKEIFQVQKKYYGLNSRSDERADSKWGDIEQWMEESEKFSRSSRIQALSDEDERTSVGSRGSVRSDLDSVGGYGGGGSSLLKKSKKKKKHKHRDKDRNGSDDGCSALSSRSSRLSDDSRISRPSGAERQPSFQSFTSSDLFDLNGLSSLRNAGLSLNGYQSSLYEDGLSLCSGSRRVSASGSHPVEYSSYRSSRASSRASSARASPVAEDREYHEKGSRAASALTAATLTSLGGTSSRRGSGETALTVDAESSLREIKEIHELKDQIQDVETKYTQNLKEVKDALVEVEEKYRKAMVSNAQLDNENNNLMYQVDTLKDSLMELEELLSESRREHEEKLKELEREKHAHGVLQFQFCQVKETLKQSEELLTEIRQLRTKQDAYVSQISDLQETVEWKDKKMGALERQKEYSDAIRVERDELREEAVTLRDILKKHGIIVGPDLSVNGDAGASEVDGPPGAEPVPGTSAPEGTSVLGGTVEAQVRPCRKEEMDPEQEEETLEENYENQNAERRVAEASCDQHTPEESEICSTVELHGSEENERIVEPGVRPASEDKALIIVNRDLHVSQTWTPERDEFNSGSALTETETKSSSTESRGNNLAHDQQSKQEAGEGGVVKQELATKPNAEAQREPEEAENEDAEETASKTRAQVATASGKKKKKKKKAKKKTGAPENRDQQRPGTENDKCQRDSVVRTNGSTGEAGNAKSSTAAKLDHPEHDEAEAAKPSGNLSLQELNPDPGSDGRCQETNGKMLEDVDVQESTKTPQHAETGGGRVEETHTEEETRDCEGPAVADDSGTTGPGPGGLPTSDDPDTVTLSSEGASTREDASDVRRSTTDHVSEDEGKAQASKMLEQSETAGSQETLEQQQNEEKSTQPGDSKSEEAPEPLQESAPVSKTLEKAEAAPKETPEPEKPQSQMETAEGPAKVETTQGPGESEKSETDAKAISDVEDPESESGPDPKTNLLASRKGEDPDEEFTPDKSLPEEASGVQNTLAESGAVDGDEEDPGDITNDPESVMDVAGEEDEAETRVPAEESESRISSEVEEDKPLTSSTLSSTNSSTKEPRGVEPDDGRPRPGISEEVCQEDEEVEGAGEPEDPPEQASSLPMKDEVEEVNLAVVESQEEKETTPELPEPENPPKHQEADSSECPPKEPMIESNMQELDGDESSPIVQPDGSEKDGEEDEGQSFDFDDLDIEAAVESALSEKRETGGVGDGDRKTSGRQQNTTDTNAESGKKVSEDVSNPVGYVGPEEVENVPETVEQKMMAAVDEGLDAVETLLDLQKTPEQTGDREAPQSGKDSKKKKGKGKNKEDCKMS